MIDQEMLNNSLRIKKVTKKIGKKTYMENIK